MSIFREYATGALTPADLDQLGAEISDATGVGVTVSVESGRDLAGDPDPTKDRVRFYSPAGAPDGPTLDAAVAAYPQLAAGVTGTFAASKNTDYTLYESHVAEGETVVLDVHAHISMGVAGSFTTEYVDWYVIAWREVGGSVQRDSASAVGVGTVPGAIVSAIGTASTIKIVISAQRAGSITIHKNDIEEESRGAVPV